MSGTIYEVIDHGRVVSAHRSREAAERVRDARSSVVPDADGIGAFVRERRTGQSTARPVRSATFASNVVGSNGWGCNPSRIAYSDGRSPRSRPVSREFAPEILALAEQLGWAPKTVQARITLARKRGHLPADQNSLAALLAKFSI